MNILAIDSSAVTATAAILSGDTVVAEASVTTALTHSQTLLPMIKNVLSSAGLSPQDIDLFAVANGPGSFTGLRIGVGTVKGLAYALSKPAVGISALEALAYNVSVSPFLIAPVMDARRGEVYCALYRFEGGRIKEVSPPCAKPAAEFAESIGEKTVFVGDGVAPHRETFAEILGENAIFAPPNARLQRAASVALAARAQKDRGSAHELGVRYIRKPQAEREYERAASTPKKSGGADI